VEARENQHRKGFGVGRGGWSLEVEVEVGSCCQHSGHNSITAQLLLLVLQHTRFCKGREYPRLPVKLPAPTSAPPSETEAQ
jgi:hypothetical protein